MQGPKSRQRANKHQKIIHDNKDKSARYNRINNNTGESITKHTLYTYAFRERFIYLDTICVYTPTYTQSIATGMHGLPRPVKRPVFRSSSVKRPVLRSACIQ